jgi:hypothetical protein
VVVVVDTRSGARKALAAAGYAGALLAAIAAAGAARAHLGA